MCCITGHYTTGKQPLRFGIKRVSNIQITLAKGLFSGGGKKKNLRFHAGSPETDGTVLFADDYRSCGKDSRLHYRGVQVCIPGQRQILQVR